MLCRCTRGKWKGDGVDGVDGVNGVNGSDGVDGGGGAGASGSGEEEEEEGKAGEAKSEKNKSRWEEVRVAAATAPRRCDVRRYRVQHPSKPGASVDLSIHPPATRRSGSAIA